MTSVNVVVHGIPAPQGSKRHVGNGVMIENSKKLGPWREAVRAETARQRNGVTFGHGTPVKVVVMFFLPRPAGHYGNGRNALTLRPSAPRMPAARPDIDKLSRAVLDALTAGGAYADDGQVAALHVAKFYADDNEPGCYVVVNAL